jgi:hypothetical protein
MQWESWEPKINEYSKKLDLMAQIIKDNLLITIAPKFVSHQLAGYFSVELMIRITSQEQLSATNFPTLSIWRNSKLTITPVYKKSALQVMINF